MLIPYVDNATFTEAPTNIDVSQIVPAGTNAAQSAELTNILERASSWVDIYCQQRLAATTDSEVWRGKPNRQGQLEIFPRSFPLISLVSAQWIDLASGSASAWTAIDTAYVLPLERSFLIYDRSYSYWRGWGRWPLVVQYEYENGFAHTTLTGPVVGTSTVVPAGSTSITVSSTVGITTTAAGPSAWAQESELLILDGSARERVQVSAISGQTLTLASAMVNDHSVGALVTAVPGGVQQSVIDFAAFLIKKRGTGSFQMTQRGVGKQQDGGAVALVSGLDEAYARLQPYQRVGAA